MVNNMHSLDLESIERLADKIQSLVQLLERTQNELNQTAADNGRLTTEIDELRNRLALLQRDSGEMDKLLEEREQIRTRVASMLEQLEGLNL
jgi:regulator of replication initiation timing